MFKLFSFKFNVLIIFLSLFNFFIDLLSSPSVNFEFFHVSLNDVPKDDNNSLIKVFFIKFLFIFSLDNSKFVGAIFNLKSFLLFPNLSIFFLFIFKFRDEMLLFSILIKLLSNVFKYSLLTLESNIFDFMFLL